LARLLKRAVKAIIDVPPLAFPTGGHVEAWATILGVPVVSGQLPEAGLVHIEGYIVHEDIRRGRFKWMMTRTFGRRGSKARETRAAGVGVLAGIFPPGEANKRGFPQTEPDILQKVTGVSWGSLIGARIAWT
jgi:hypothetical protein